MDSLLYANPQCEPDGRCVVNQLNEHRPSGAPPCTAALKQSATLKCGPNRYLLKNRSRLTGRQHPSGSRQLYDYFLVSAVSVLGFVDLVVGMRARRDHFRKKGVGR